MPRHGSRLNPHNDPNLPGYNPRIPSRGAYGGNQVNYGGPSVNGPARRPMYGQNQGQGYNMRPNMQRPPSRGYGQRQPMGYGGRPQPGGRRPNMASMLRSLGRRRVV